MLSAAAVCTVTTGAVGREDCGAGRLRLQCTQRDDAKKKALDEDTLPPNDLFALLKQEL
jgi:hypothetical protein